MRYILIEDKYHSIKPLLTEDKPEIVTGESLTEIVEKIVALSLDPFDIIIINCESVFADNDSQVDFRGVELLKWLRVHLKICNRIIMASFLNREFLLQKTPQDYILFAPGNYFLLLPFTNDELNTLKRNSSNVKSEEILVEYYKPFVFPDFNILDISHSFSNDFGLHLLDEFFQKEILELPITKDSRNLSFSKAKLLYKIDTENDLARIVELKKLRNRVNELIKEKTVVHIDDKGADGWFALIKKLFDKDNVKGILPEIADNGTEINLISTIEKIKRKKPNIIFLDLRLLGDREINLSIPETSGALLLEEIRKWNPSIPVLLTSATDRLKSLEILSKIPYSINGVWTKPRVEKAGFSTLSVVENLFLKTEALIKESNDEIGLCFSHFNFVNLTKRLPELSSFIDNYDYIIFDANYFCETGSMLKNHLAYFSSLVKNSRTIGNPKVVIVDDVINEVYLNSVKSTSISILSRVSRFSAKLLSELQNNERIKRLEDEVRKCVDKKLIAEHATRKVKGKEKYDIYYSLKIKQDASNSLENANSKVAALNSEITKNSGIIHADNIFQFLIKYLTNKNKKVLFVSDDITCKRNILLRMARKGIRVNDLFLADYKIDEQGDFIKIKDMKVRTSEHRNTDIVNLEKNGINDCTLVSNSRFIKKISVR